jgi:hypothetical protein
MLSANLSRGGGGARAIEIKNRNARAMRRHQASSGEP